MWRKLTISLALAAIALAGLAWPSGGEAQAAAKAAAKVNFQKIRKTQSGKARVTRIIRKRKSVRRARTVRKSAIRPRRTNFKTYTRKLKPARRATARRAATRSGNRKLAALLGSSTRRPAFTRREGQIYAGGRYLGKTTVKFNRKLKPGSILVKTKERALYYVLPGGKAIKYGVGVGREGFQWSGSHRITNKKEWPEWRPPEEMKQRELAQYGRKLPDVMPGGPENPLGARALYIGNTLYRIHGTNNPRSIGKFVSSGCIRMVNDEVIDLYNRVKVGARVIVE